MSKPIFEQGHDDPAVTARTDQLRAEAIELLRKSRVWFLGVALGDGTASKGTVISGGELTSRAESIDFLKNVEQAARTARELVEGKRSGEEAELGEVPQRCPNPDCPVKRLGEAYTECPRCGGELEQA